MKTALQEIFEYWDTQNNPLVILNWIASNEKRLLEKEKEQIVDACNANLKGLLTNGKDYYDLNFNHQIESEPNTYTNFTPHNANAVAEYNEGLKNFTPNKQPMKLYTEEQIKSIYRVGIIDGKCDADINNIDYLIFDGLTTIELPSDEEIKSYSDKYSTIHEDVSDKLGKYLVSAIHIDGAKWMKEQILKNK
jgi:hypothetical protein